MHHSAWGRELSVPRNATHEWRAVRGPVPVFGQAEISLLLAAPGLGNPFTQARLQGTFTDPAGESMTVDGFCDEPDGSVFRIRCMPRTSGTYTFALRFRSHDGADLSHTGSFEAAPSEHEGVVQIDPDHTWHFLFSRSRRHFFWNATTAYYLMGWRDERVIEAILDRLASKGVNRVRVLLYGRQWDRPWNQPVVSSDGFTMMLNPWPCLFPEDASSPEFDLSRFNVEHWRAYERVIGFAAARDIQVSVVFSIGGQPLCVPYAELSEDEYRYYRYAAARFSAFPNIMWDLANEGDFHRCPYHHWARTVAEAVRRWDPYDHILGTHNAHLPQWWPNSVQLMQDWDAGLNKLCLERRDVQQKTSRPVPHVIEEYGYEDLWEAVPGQRSTDTRRRVAWETAMAGCYSTAGETAARGTGVAPDSGGGWINGRGDHTMTMLDSLRPLVSLFTSLQWWVLDPHNDLVISYERGTAEHVPYYYQDGREADDVPAMVLADPGKTYVVYMPFGGTATVRLDGGDYTLRRFDPRTGAWQEAGRAAGGDWPTPSFAGTDDWVLLLQKA